jgi:hypothetical protein
LHPTLRDETAKDGAPGLLPVGWRERQKQIPHSTSLRAGSSGMTTKRAKAKGGNGGGAGLLFAEDVAHAADLGTYAAEFFFEVLVAAIEVVDAVEDGFAVGD